MRTLSVKCGEQGPLIDTAWRRHSGAPGMETGEGGKVGTSVHEGLLAGTK